MALAVFGFTYLGAAAILGGVGRLARGERRMRAFKAVSPGLLSPLGILFGLLVAFTAAQVWNDIERAKTAVAREAGALTTVLSMAASFPGDAEAEMRALVRRYIDDATKLEWPVMAGLASVLPITPRPLAQALRLTLALDPASKGQEIAQREIAAALGDALDARRQRIIVAYSQVNLVKWASLLIVGLAVLVAIAMVHCDNRIAAGIAMGLFATGMAVSVLLIASHDRPFTGDIAVKPEPLLHVLPESQGGWK
jgi:uncharacterized MnhB-related membrane protein